jgi:hypothetical protein
MCKVSAFLIVLSCFSSVFAQTTDFGVWSSIGAKKKLGKWKLGIYTELRTNDNTRQIHRLDYKLDVEYDVVKAVEIGVSYKFIYFNDVKYFDYQPRQRYTLHVQGEQKFGDFKVSLREKVQRTIKDESDRQKENGDYDNYKINPDWIWRNRLKIDYNIPHFRVNPSISFETFYLLNNPDGNTFNNLRYTLELNYKLSKHHAFEIYGLIEKEIHVDNPLTTYISGIGYVLTF